MTYAIWTIDGFVRSTIKGWGIAEESSGITSWKTEHGARAAIAKLRDKLLPHSSGQRRAWAATMVVKPVTVDTVATHDKRRLHFAGLVEKVAAMYVDITIARRHRQRLSLQWGTLDRVVRCGDADTEEMRAAKEACEVAAEALRVFVRDNPDARWLVDANHGLSPTEAQVSA